MGYAKYAEDIREAVEERMRYSERTYENTTCFNEPPYRTSRDTGFRYTTVKPATTVQTTYSTPSYYRPPCKIISSPKYIPTKVKIADVRRCYEHNGIEIYFYRRPSEEIRNKLKANYWNWHTQKKCWFRSYSASNMAFAESISEQ